MVGHCLKNRGGYLFFGDKFIPKPPTQISWTPILTPSKGHYFAGQADLLYNEIHTPIKGLNVMFDSGTTLSYLNSKDYEVLLKLINTELNNKGTFKQAEEDDLICWTGKIFQSIDQVSKDYLKPIILSITNNKNNVKFELLVKHYIKLSSKGNICLLIETDFDDDDNNVIGALSMKDKIMIFDNERKQIGWVPDDCTKLPQHRWSLEA